VSYLVTEEGLVGRNVFNLVMFTTFILSIYIVNFLLLVLTPDLFKFLIVCYLFILLFLVIYFCNGHLVSTEFNDKLHI